MVTVGFVCINCHQLWATGFVIGSGEGWEGRGGENRGQGLKGGRSLHLAAKGSS